MIDRRKKYLMVMDTLTDLAETTQNTESLMRLTHLVGSVHDVMHMDELEEPKLEPLQ